MYDPIGIDSDDLDISPVGPECRANLIIEHPLDLRPDQSMIKDNCFNVHDVPRGEGYKFDRLRNCRLRPQRKHLRPAIQVAKIEGSEVRNQWTIMNVRLTAKIDRT